MKEQKNGTEAGEGAKLAHVHGLFQNLSLSQRHDAHHSLKNCLFGIPALKKKRMFELEIDLMLLSHGEASTNQCSNQEEK